MIDEYEQPTFCANPECRLQLASDRAVLHRVQNTQLSDYKGATPKFVDLCAACSDMFDVVHQRTFFVEAETEFRNKRRRKNLLRPDVDYFHGDGA